MAVKQVVRTTKSSQAKPAQRIFWVLVILTVVGIPVSLSLDRLAESRFRARQWLPVLGTVSDFTLTESSGRPFSLKELARTVWIADFMFTHCPGQCPRMNLEMSRLQKLLPPAIRFVSFTVDPGRDTPAVLAGYAASYAGEKGRWFFLTGDQKPLNRVAASFHMSSIEDPNAHSIRLVLVDGNGRIRGYYDPLDARDVSKLVSDAEALVRKAGL